MVNFTFISHLFLYNTYQNFKDSNSIWRMIMKTIITTLMVLAIGAFASEANVTKKADANTTKKVEKKAKAEKNATKVEANKTK